MASQALTRSKPIDTYVALTVMSIECLERQAPNTAMFFACRANLVAIIGRGVVVPVALVVVVEVALGKRPFRLAPFDTGFSHQVAREAWMSRFLAGGGRHGTSGSANGSGSEDAAPDATRTIPRCAKWFKLDACAHVAAYNGSKYAW